MRIEADHRFDPVSKLVGSLEMASTEVRVPGPDSNGVEATNELRATFKHLCEQWGRERMFLSSTTEMVGCPSYGRIVEMGWGVLPLIFEQLQLEGDNPGHWYLALSEITGADPVAEGDYGYMDRIASAWLGWADENGYA